MTYSHNFGSANRRRPDDIKRVVGSAAKWNKIKCVRRVFATKRGIERRRKREEVREQKGYRREKENAGGAGEEDGYT